MTQERERAFEEVLLREKILKGWEDRKCASDEAAREWTPETCELCRTQRGQSSHRIASRHSHAICCCGIPRHIPSPSPPHTHPRLDDGAPHGVTQAAAGLHEPLRAHHLIARSLLRSCVRSIDQVVSRVSNIGKYRGCRNYKCVKSACSVRVHVKITTTYTAFTTVRVRDPDSECNTRVTTRSTTIKIHMTQHVSHYAQRLYTHRLASRPARETYLLCQAPRRPARNGDEGGQLTFGRTSVDHPRHLKDVPPPADDGKPRVASAGACVRLSLNISS